MCMLVLSGACAAWASQGSEEEEPVSVGLIIANPEKFDGRQVRVSGFLDYGGGLDRSVCLYPSKPDARNDRKLNCIGLDLSASKNDKRLGEYVILNATFRYLNRQRVKILYFKDVSDMKVWSAPLDK